MEFRIRDQVKPAPDPKLRYAHPRTPNDPAAFLSAGRPPLVDAPGHEWGFGIYSTGANGVTFSGGNDRDDINGWDLTTPWLKYYEKQRLRRQALIWSAAVLAIVAVLSWWFGPLLRPVLRRRPDGFCRPGGR